ncbi:MAG: tetratricopeptide repeat protein [Pseudomonadota bacterium]
MKPETDHPGGDAASDLPQPDTRWREMMERGNAAFLADSYEAALAFYLGGVLEAERLLFSALAGTAREGAAPGPALVVATNNAANAYMNDGRPQEALHILEHASSLLRKAVLDNGAPAAVRMNCLRDMQRAYANLLAHLHKTGAPQAEIDRAFRMAKSAAQSCLAAVKPKPRPGRNFH